jgi:DNA-binding transcriptional ArsR family regulator
MALTQAQITASHDLSGQALSDSTRRAASALGHPRRIHILLALAAGPGSATSLAKSIDETLTRKDVEYHLRVLAEAGAVMPAGDRQVRGATERLYGLPSSRSGSTTLGEQIPEAILLGLEHAWTGEYEQSKTSGGSKRDTVSGSSENSDSAKGNAAQRNK